MTRSWIHAALFLASPCLTGGVACRAQSDAPPSVSAETVRTAHYLANAGVLVVNGDTRVVFDPLFRNDFDTYQLLPSELEEALFAGTPPFEGLDAIFISHYHEDHFSPADVLRLLSEHEELRLYAPAQAVAGMREIAEDGHDGVFDRVTSIALEVGQAPKILEERDILVEAVRIPHSGWPERQLGVENLAYRVTLDDEATVVHLGDADTRDEHFARDADYWERRHTHMAFPPYWFFLSEDGRSVLERRLKPEHSVGVHVPVEPPDELEGYDVFTEPGETRGLPR